MNKVKGVGNEDARGDDLAFSQRASLGYAVSQGLTLRLVYDDAHAIFQVKTVAHAWQDGVAQGGRPGGPFAHVVRMDVVLIMGRRKEYQTHGPIERNVTSGVMCLYAMLSEKARHAVAAI